MGDIIGKEDFINNIKVCVITVAKNENEWIEEWIKYHFNLGFDRIIIIDNNSEENKTIYDDDRVEIIPERIQFGDNWGMGGGTQPQLLNKALDVVKSEKIDYCASIDVDEFIELRKHNNIKEFIYDEVYKSGKNIAEVLWEYYDDNDIIYEKDTKKSVLETYTRKASKYGDINRKSIFKVYDETFFDGVHFPSSSLFEKGLYFTNHTDTNVAVIRHYRTKCLETYIRNKVKNNRCNKGFNGIIKDIISFYFSFNELTIEKVKGLIYLLKKYDVEI
jgi:cellulose synthase/poly-beta-1,6-N-acetylglucosamine synthase-like glycosyltransferase